MMEKMIMVMIVIYDDDDRVVLEGALSIRLLEVSSWFACPLERYHSKVERTCLGRSNCSPFSGGRGGHIPDTKCGLSKASLDC